MARNLTKLGIKITSRDLWCGLGLSLSRPASLLALLCQVLLVLAIVSLLASRLISQEREHSNQQGLILRTLLDGKSEEIKQVMHEVASNISTDLLSISNFKNKARDLIDSKDPPAFQFLAFATVVEDRNATTLENRVRDELGQADALFQTFQIRSVSSLPWHAIVLAALSKSDAVTIIGEDLTNDQRLVTALERARDSGEFVSTKLSQASPMDGLVIGIEPIYNRDLPLSSQLARRVALSGFILAGTNIQDLIAPVLDGQQAEIDISHTEDSSVGSNHVSSSSIEVPLNLGVGDLVVRLAQPRIDINWILSSKKLWGVATLAFIYLSIWIVGSALVNAWIRRSILRISGMSKILQIREEQIKVLTEGIPIGIGLFARTGECLFVNRQMQRLTGQGFNGLGKGRWTALFPGEDQIELAEAFEAAVIAGTEKQALMRVTSGNSTEVHVSVHLLPVRGKRHVNGLILLLEDVTKSRNMELQLSKSTQEVKELQTQILELKNAAKMEFAKTSLQGESIESTPSNFKEPNYSQVKPQADIDSAKVESSAREWLAQKLRHITKFLFDADTKSSNSSKACRRSVGRDESILIVDGSQYKQISLVRHLRATGVVPTLVCDREQLIDSLCNKDFSMVLLGDEIPGFEIPHLIECVRARSEHIPIIALNSEPKEQARLMELGCDECVANPKDRTGIENLLSGRFSSSRTNG